MILTPTTESPEESSAADDVSVHPSQVSFVITGALSLAAGQIETVLMSMVADIKASGLPKRVGLFSGQYYILIKGDNFTKQSKTTKYAQDGEYVAAWNDSITLYATVNVLLVG